MKTCGACKVAKELTEFNPRADGSPGVRSTCKACASAKSCATSKAKRGPKKPIMTAEERAEARKATYHRLNAKPSRKAKQAFYEANRRAQKLQATPKWLTAHDFAGIQLFYDMAKPMGDYVGHKFEVDHIVPLRGENVSGLHVPWNLQLLEHTANNSKGNRVDWK